MQPSTSQMISEFLAQSDGLMAHVNELPANDAQELYALLQMMARTASEKIPEIDPALRKILCERLDQVLERLVDVSPSPNIPGTGVFTPAVQGYRRWENVELMKDKGLAGYMLAKEIEGRPVMYFGAKPEDYPYTDSLPGLTMLYTDEAIGSPDVYMEHLAKNYSGMDALMLHGLYGETAAYLAAYRKLRPDGKVFCGLDMSRYWMGNVRWDSPAVRHFGLQCNAIATSCRAVRDALNENPKAPFYCRWLPNGFYNPIGEKIVADAETKQNVILTVGKIGTKVKNNAELLAAFGKACKYLPGWSLRLVGTIEEEFKPVLGEFFQVFPHLKERVVLTGPITNKAELYREYARAKLFAITSLSEGGTPNVYAEALFHGCLFVTSDIDGADDITNYGRLGKKYSLGDTDALATALIDTALMAERPALDAHIKEALCYANTYYDWARNAKKLAFMLYH